MPSNIEAGQGKNFNRNLSRHRDRIERDMAAMNRLSTSKTEYNKKYVAQGTRADITEIE